MVIISNDGQQFDSVLLPLDATVVIRLARSELNSYGHPPALGQAEFFALLLQIFDAVAKCLELGQEPFAVCAAVSLRSRVSNNVPRGAKCDPGHISINGQVTFEFVCHSLKL